MAPPTTFSVEKKQQLPRVCPLWRCITVFAQTKRGALNAPTLHGRFPMWGKKLNLVNLLFFRNTNNFIIVANRFVVPSHWIFIASRVAIIDLDYAALSAATSRESP